MLEDCEESISLTLRTWSSRQSIRMLERNWKHQWLQPPCKKTSVRRPKQDSWFQVNNFVCHCLKHREDPEVIDTGISSIKVSQKNTWFLPSTRDMDQSGCLNLKDVVCHFPWWDASLWGVNASHSVPVNPSTYGRSKGVYNHNCTKLTCEVRQEIEHSTLSAPFQNSFTSIKEELRTQTTSKPSCLSISCLAPSTFSFSVYLFSILHNFYNVVSAEA